MVIGIIAIAVAFIIFPMVLDATSGILSHSGDIMQIDAKTTGAANTTAPIVLDFDLYEADVANVASITSTLETDAPTADSYVEGTKTLTAGGLTVNSTRELATTYETESMDVYTGLGPIAKVAPLMVFIGLIAGGGFGLYTGIKASRGKRG